MASQYSSATHCISGEAARDQDRRLAAKNACRKRIDAAFDAAKPEVIELLVKAADLKYPYRAPHKAADVRSELALIRYENPQYKAASKKCFTDNGFN